MYGPNNMGKDNSSNDGRSRSRGSCKSKIAEGYRPTECKCVTICRISSLTSAQLLGVLGIALCSNQPVGDSDFLAAAKFVRLKFYPRNSRSMLGIVFLGAVQ
jgi:hypothetical protein